MSTALKIGPADHGRNMSLDEYLSSEYEHGFRYELINGSLFVSPEANQPHDWVEKHVFMELWTYSRENPHVINHVSDKARVFVPSNTGTTCPEPDIAAYRDFPVDRGPKVQWNEISPLLVAEVLSDDGIEKDLDRNVRLYWDLPSIEEYWVIDNRESASRPTLLAHRRRQDAWAIATLEAGEIYETPILPGFELAIDFGNQG